MSDQRVRCGPVAFRNHDHFSWSLISLSLAVVAVVVRVVEGRCDPFVYKQLSLVFGLGHSIITLQAVRFVLIRKQPDTAFSIDCIWFNALLVVFYGVVFWS
jgi:hypothetical protein